MKSDRLKVLILSFEYPPKAGAGTHVFELATGLTRAGIETGILAVTPCEGRIYEEDGVAVNLVAPSPETCSAASRLSAPQGVLAVSNDLIAYGKSLLMKDRKRPDMIHCHDWYTYPAARELGAGFGIPVVGTAHSTSEPIVRWWGELPDQEVLRQEKSFYRNSDRLITVSESMKGIISATHGVSDDRIDVVHNGLDWRRFAGSGLTADQRKRLRERVAADDEQIIVFAGRLTAQKGVRALLKSAELVIEEHKSVKYLIAGEADSLHSSQMVEEMIRGQRAMSERMKLLGRVERKQLGMIYQVADIAVVPSIYEPFGYAAVEAMAIGVAVIVTGVGGLNEIVEQERSGLKVEVKDEGGGRKEVDVGGLARAQVRLLREEETRKRIGEEGQRRVKEMFNVERMVDRTLLVYRKVITRREAVA